MIERRLYIGYKESDLYIKGHESVITASLAYYKDMVILYYECRNDVSPKEIVQGNMRKFPDGEEWFKTAEIFHYYSIDNEEKWCRKIKKKTPIFHINFLLEDKISSYIHHHYLHQSGNQYDCDRYLSMFIYKNMVIMYGESPVEKVLYKEIKDKVNIPCPENWVELMNEHFKENEDGEKGWIRI